MVYIPHIIIEKFLLSQRISKAQMIIQFINTVLHPLYCSLFIFWLDLGMVGAAAVRALSEIVYTASLILYMKLSKCCEKTLIAPTMDVFKDWKPFLSIAFPSLFMTCLEWWGFEAMSLMSGKLGVIDLAANVICFNYSAFLFMVGLGVSLATGTLVGNSIGENNIKKAKIYTKLGVYMTTFIILILGIIIIVFKSFFARVFTGDEEVASLLETLLYLVVVDVIFDTNQITLAKIIIALGKQSYATWINLIAYWFLMLPIGIITGFWLNWRVHGVWFGIIIASLTACIGNGYILCKTDWNNLRKVTLEKQA